MKFELDDDQIKKLREWQFGIFNIFGEYGLYTFKFTPNGIGSTVEVYSHLAKVSLDLTDLDKW